MFRTKTNQTEPLSGYGASLVYNTFFLSKWRPCLWAKIQTNFIISWLQMVHLTLSYSFFMFGDPYSVYSSSAIFSEENHPTVWISTVDTSPPYMSSVHQQWTAPLRAKTHSLNLQWMTAWESNIPSHSPLTKTKSITTGSSSYFWLNLLVQSHQVIRQDRR